MSHGEREKIRHRMPNSRCVSIGGAVSLAEIFERYASYRAVIEGRCREIVKGGGIFISICKPLFVTLIVNKGGEYCVYKVLCVFRETRISATRPKRDIGASLCLPSFFMILHPCVIRIRAFTFLARRDEFHTRPPVRPFCTIFTLP